MDKMLIKLMQKRIAKLAIGKSTLRKQGAPGVVGIAREYLTNIDLKKFAVDDVKEFEKVLNSRTNYLKTKFPDGAKNWGTARKALNVFLRDVIYNYYLRRYFMFTEKIENWLEIPLDGNIAKKIRKKFPNKISNNFTIKGLNKDESIKYQKCAQKIASKYKTNRVHLDLRWWRE